MKILYIDPVINTPTSNNYQYYDGVYNELVKQHEVTLLRGIPDNIEKFLVLNNIHVDAVVFGLGWFNHKFFGLIKGLKIPSLCVLFKPQNNLKEKLNFCKINNIDMILTPIPNFESIEKLTGIKTRLFPYGFDEKIFFDRKIEKKFDIGFSGALHENKHYPPGAFPVKNIRTKIGNILKSNNSLNTFWSSSDSYQARIPSYKEYSETINSSKVWIATQAAFGDITPRYYEVAASGTLLFCQKVPKNYEHIFIDQYNCIQFDNDLENFEQKLIECLADDCKRQKIITNANIFFQNEFTWKKRAENMILYLEEIINENK